MPQTNQRSFTSGELAPALQSRADLSRYANGLNLCENFFVRSQGGAYSRPGLRHIMEMSNGAGRLIPFSFNTEQTYMLVFENNKMYVIKDGAQVLDPVLNPLPYFINTPYTLADLPDLRFAQNADTMTLVHPNHDPRNLGRLADDNWTLNVIDYSPQTTGVGALALTSVGDVNGGGDYDKTYTYVVTGVDQNGVESLATLPVSITQKSLSTVYGVRLTWAGNSLVHSYYRIYKDPSDGSGVYGWIGDSNNEVFDDFNIAPVTSDSPPENREPFNGAGNKPSAVTYYQQRQIFAATRNEPQSVYTTQVNTYDSLRTSNPARDDDAVTFTIAASQVNEIRHLLPLDSLVLLTSGGEWITTEGGDGVLTPSTIGVRIQSYNGCSKVPPVVINSTALFLQEKGARLRDLGYQFNSDKYTGNDLSIMSEHLFDGYEIVDMAYAAEPYSIVWCVRDDGVLLGLTYQREHEVMAWHKHTTQGEFESVASVAEDRRDAVYVIVKRTIDGVERRFVERMEKRETKVVENVFCVDCGVTYEGAAATVISGSGLGHLLGEEVAILADGNVVPNQVVVLGDNGAQITLPFPASKVQIGLPYLPAMESLDLDTASPTESLKANSVSVAKVTLECEATRGGWVGARLDAGGTNKMMEIKPRFDVYGYDTQELLTFKQDVFLEPQWSRGGGVRIEQRVPLPMAILSIIPQVDVGGN